MSVSHLYQYPGLDDEELLKIKSRLFQLHPEWSNFISTLNVEYCFNILGAFDLSTNEEKLRYLLGSNLKQSSVFDGKDDSSSCICVEVGPRLNFTSAWSTNAISILQSCGIDGISRIERSLRYIISFNKESVPIKDSEIFSALHDRMTEQIYRSPIERFETTIIPETTYEVNVIDGGKESLLQISQKLGLAFDDHDLEFYLNMFKNEMGRNPTNVECFDIGQSNSEHCRHWFFRGIMTLDGVPQKERLWDLVKAPYLANPNNSVIAFADNSSAIRGTKIKTLIPVTGRAASVMNLTEVDYDLTFTAETHNFPCGVAPFPGAETGTGGRIRDGHATGKGSLVLAGTAAYCVGNLNIPGYSLPWENNSFDYPSNLAKPLQILIDASNGASDYGNKFGEPLIQGFTRTFGQRVHDGSRREWIKPIMFSGGVGQIDHRHLRKDIPSKGMLVVKIGGPAYRIGMGGGAASSMFQGENDEQLDFNAVQRGDAEMEQKVNRVIRACVELGESNPIVSIHDQGAGGNGNVLKEIAYPGGALIDIRKLFIGDSTLSVMELWGAEYQENDALLLRQESLSVFSEICYREKAPFAVLGEITGDGRFVLIDSSVSDKTGNSIQYKPVDLDLEKMLGDDLPPKHYNLTHYDTTSLPSVSDTLLNEVSIDEALDRILRLPSVGSKRFLVNKVDRSVTGLIAQQQCVGPLHTPLANVAVTAQSHFSITGSAIAIGESPIKGLINPAAMARMSVGEALTNLMWASISKLEDVRASGNWMYAAKMDGEGAAMYDAAKSLSNFMINLGIAIDGGKDSLSMAAKAPNGEVVKAPGNLVISAYAPCTDITLTVTPDLKPIDDSILLYLDFGDGNTRLGGSAFTQVFSELGCEVPDVQNDSLLKNGFHAVQKMVKQKLISAGHDRSDGGLLVTLLEMAFAGNLGIEIEIPNNVSNGKTIAEFLFNEELGAVIQVPSAFLKEVHSILDEHKVLYHSIGKVITNLVVRLSFDRSEVFCRDMRELRSIWEETSFQIELLQSNPECAKLEKASLLSRRGQSYSIGFDYVSQCIPSSETRVAVIRQEGSNGDREMMSAFYSAGFEVWDIHMSDLIAERVTLDAFQGIAFVGGFSFADVLGSGKGWAGTIKFSSSLQGMFDSFVNRKDTFSLGVCNGCQLMVQLGWVPFSSSSNLPNSRSQLKHNISGRFESRWSSVLVEDSPAIMLKGMSKSVLGVWVAHGEGRFDFDEGSLDVLERTNLVSLRYVDDEHQPTEDYPYNPNGSPNGIAALCSPDGRHLAMMPHPERSFLSWQWPYADEKIKSKLMAPWIRMFENAFRFTAEFH